MFLTARHTAARAQASSVRTLSWTRALRGFVDGLVSVVLPAHLGRLGFSAVEIGAVITATLFGSAVLTMTVGLAAHRLDGRRILLACSALMVATGVGFIVCDSFWPLVAVAFVGTLNPTAADVTAFLPIEQTLLSDAVDRAAARDAERGEETVVKYRGRARATADVFARYNLSGALAGAAGALASSLPALLARGAGRPLPSLEHAAFVLYAATGLLAAALYRRLPPAAAQSPSSPPAPLARSRRTVLRLAALFSLDSFAGGFVVQSMLVLWLYRRFGLSVETAGAIFFAAGLAGAFSQLIASRIAARSGLVRTMVFTHLPSNALLALAGLMPSAPLAVTFLLLRAGLSQMDVPARQAFVMQVVPPAERAAASSVTNVPRSLASAAAPFFAGLMLERSSFGWPLLVAGALKAVYDLALFQQFRRVAPGQP